MSARSSSASSHDTRRSGAEGTADEPHDLNELLDIIENVADRNREVSFRKLYDAAGH